MKVVVNYWWVIVIGLIFAAASAFAYYWRDRRFYEIKKIWIWLLAALRFLSVWLIVILLAGILIKRTSYTTEKPIIAWLQDNSKSISYVLDSNTISNYLNRQKQIIKKLNGKYNIQFFTFDRNITHNGKIDFKGNYTNISKAITTIKQQFYNQNLGAIILVSDGIYNLGLNPMDIPQLKTIPIYTILLGDTTTHNDLKITQIRNNAISYFGNEFPVQVTVQAEGLKNKNSTLKIFLNGKLKAKKTFTITSNNFSKKFLFYLKADSPGKKLIKATVTPVNNEFTTENNQMTSTIDIISTKQKILILSAFPHPDIAAIRRALESRKNYQVTFKYIDKFHGQLKDYSLIILNQLPTANTPTPLTFKQISKLQIPVIIICGSKCDYYTFNQLNTGLIITPHSNKFNEAVPYYWHGFNLFVVNNQLIQSLNSLPPLITPSGDIKITSEAQILFKQQINDVKTDQPLIIFFPQSPLNNTKVTIFTGEGIWRWRMSLYKANKSFDLFDDLMNQIIQYTANKKQRKQFELKAPSVIDQQTPALFTAQLFDQSFNPVTTSDIKLIITDSTGKQFSYLMNKQEDFYTLNAGTFPKGIYTYTATTKLGDKTFTKKGSFIVKPINLEVIRTKADDKLLNYLASQSGARMLQAKDIDQLPKLLAENQNIQSQGVAQTIIDELISFKLLFFIIILLLTAEWFIRKYLGNL